MSASCIGTCSKCGERQFWLSDTLSLQLDDGSLKCLPHPGESGECEGAGLTLAQASERGRLYRETFYVCRHCGKSGETIAQHLTVDFLAPFTVRGAMKWGWGSAVIVIPFLAWMRWWESLAVIGGTLLASPAIYWRENKKYTRALAARGLPRADAPGLSPIAPPTVGCVEDCIVGEIITDETGQTRATGPCCDQPDWIEAFSVKDEDRVPCCMCEQGVMTVSMHSLH